MKTRSDDQNPTANYKLMLCTIYTGVSLYSCSSLVSHYLPFAMQLLSLSIKGLPLMFKLSLAHHLLLLCLLSLFFAAGSSSSFFCFFSFFGCCSSYSFISGSFLHFFLSSGSVISRLYASHQRDTLSLCSFH